MVSVNLNHWSRSLLLGGFFFFKPLYIWGTTLHCRSAHSMKTLNRQPWAKRAGQYYQLLRSGSWHLSMPFERSELPPSLLSPLQGEIGSAASVPAPQLEECNCWLLESTTDDRLFFSFPIRETWLAMTIWFICRVLLCVFSASFYVSIHWWHRSTFEMLHCQDMQDTVLCLHCAG